MAQSRPPDSAPPCREHDIAEQKEADAIVGKLSNAFASAAWAAAVGRHPIYCERIDMASWLPEACATASGVRPCLSVTVTLAAKSFVSISTISA